MHDESHRTREWFLDDGLRAQVAGALPKAHARALDALLAAQAERGAQGALVEIGVEAGQTLIGLARRAGADDAVVGFDPPMITAEALTHELIRNLQGHLTGDELARVRLDRRPAAKLDVLEWMRTLQQPARLVLLNGQRSRAAILHDLQLAASWLQPGAVVVISGFLSARHPDFSGGVLDGLSAYPQLAPVAVVPSAGDGEGALLVCSLAEGAAAYREALDRALGGELQAGADRLLGREIRVYGERPSGARPGAAGRSVAPPIVFALHDAGGTYWTYTAVALTSLAQHASQRLRVHILHDESLHSRARERLAEIAQQGGIALTLTPVQPPKGVDVGRLRQFGPASIFRLMIPQLFADEPLVIYLDSDLVVNGLDIMELAKAAPQDAPISAVQDPYIARPASHARALGELQLDPARYFNSGVLALRPGLIADDLVQGFIAFSDAHPNAIHPDQDFLNVRFAAAAHLLDPRFNAQLSHYGRALLQPLAHYDRKILHYAGKIKPLDGSLAPGLIPFWAHAYLVPELTQGRLYASPTRYLLPLEGEEDGLKSIKI